MIFYSVNPATEENIFEHATSSLKDVNDAVVAGLDFSKTWRSTSYENREKIVLRFKRLVESQKDDLATCISIETGKPLWESHQEVSAMIAKVDISIESFQKRCKQLSFESKNTIYELGYKPIGVLAVLGPFNFPLHLPHGHIIPALLSGNCIVFKPSEYTTEVAKKIILIWQQAELPEKALQLVFGKGDIGEKLYQHPLIKGVLFTGEGIIQEKNFDLFRCFS